MIVALTILGTSHSMANNIQVSNISLENLDATNQNVLVQFDLSWENSWRVSSGPSNWDAAWVFVKYRANNGDWGHANLNTNSPGVTGATVGISPDNVGAMIHRDSDGSGDVNYQSVQLRWDYGKNGITENDVLDVQVFAIEMVYVPQGAFYVGSGGTETGAFFEGGTANQPFQITSENAIPIANTSSNLYYNTSGDQLGPVPATFPKGFNAFYCMKYETSEDQWVGFFNTLNASQKANHDITDSNHKSTDGVDNRNTIAWLDGTSNATTEAPNRALGWLDHSDVLAYLDWAGLRPLTELEHEKACRGPLNPVPNEYAWGSVKITANNYTLVSDGQPGALVANPAVGSGNAWMNGLGGSLVGPVRCGIFSASAVNKNREETGGSYYGIMEFTGNAHERYITVGLPDGRQFDGEHGNGKVDSVTGDHDISNWPTTNGGLGYKGGAWRHGGTSLVAVSDRSHIALILNSAGADRGFRGGRTAF